MLLLKCPERTDLHFEFSIQMIKVNQAIHFSKWIILSICPSMMYWPQFSFDGWNSEPEFHFLPMVITFRITALKIMYINPNLPRILMLNQPLFMIVQPPYLH
jgi:hypothetical protein